MDAGKLPAAAWAALLGLAVVKVAAHLLSAAFLAYGYMSDEFYYLDCASRLDWGYVDHPPFSVAALRIMRELLGDSLVAIRVLPALAGAATILLVGAMARELGGGPEAQKLAGLVTLLAPMLLAVSGFHSMNALEPAIWAAAAYVLLRIFNGAGVRCWLLVGVVLGIGLLNKVSTFWFGMGVAVGLCLTRQRRWLGTPWPWVAGAVALAIFTPHLFWQIRHEWPTIEFMRNAAELKMPAKSPLTFVGEQALIMHPLFVPFWLSGLAYLFFAREARPYRALGWIWLTVFALLMSSGRARSNYIGPAYTVLFAAGGVGVERAARTRRWLVPLTAGVCVAGGLAVVPLAIDVLPPDTYVRYERAIGLSAPQDETSALGALPLHFALRFGWPELAVTVSRIYDSLPAEERARTGIIAETFGESGAINFYGRRLGLPGAIGTHNSYWMWGPGSYTGEVMIVVAAPDSPLLRFFESVEATAAVECDYCMPWLRAHHVFIARGMRRPLPDSWPELKKFL